jgi:ribosomal protein L11 methyltransferase
MKWIEAKVKFEYDNPEIAADLISQIFYSIGVKGIVVEDPFLEPKEGWDKGTATRPVHHGVTGYISGQTQPQKQCQMLAKKLAQLQKKIGICFQIIFTQVDDEDWAESWKAHFRPQKISQHLVVEPTWYDYEARSDEIVIKIDPGMAFGTGTHPTTRLCLNMIETYLKKDDTFLDVGTGSGILMIAAAKLGAKKICGIDNDKSTLPVAKKNIMLNNINPTLYKLVCGNLIDPLDERFDLVAANILTEAIMVLLDKIKKVLQFNGRFICSGIIEEHQNTIIDKMKSLDFEIIKIYSMQKWVAIAGKLN